MLVIAKMLSSFEDAILVRAKRQKFKKKHGIVNWGSVFNYLPLK